MNKIELVKEYLNKENIDAWIIIDYEMKNPVVCSLLGNRMLTRKLFMVIPKEGKPYLITHSIDTVFLHDIKDGFDLKIYHSWKEMLDLEKANFSSYKKVLMDVSSYGLLPRVSLADYGSVSYITSLGIEVISSADLLQYFSAVYDKDSYQTQVYACQKALEIKDEAFKLIKEDILKQGYSDEYRIQQFIAKRFHEEGMVYDDEPIVAISHNASNPHYGPTAQVHSKISKGDVVLIDMWAKKDVENGVYADITWMGYVGESVPEEVSSRFNILRKAVDDAFRFIKDNIKKRKVCGYEVDDVSRAVVKEAGFDEYFTHRTGHNIAVDVSPHGPGVNIDNYETHDERSLISGITFSLEPGIYAPDFGMRVETDVYIDEDMNPIMIGGRQEEVIAILK